MKKRLLLILAFGVSFAPPVFADGISTRDLLASATTGQNQVLQGGEWTYCAKLNKMIPVSSSGSHDSKNGSDVGGAN